MANIFEKIGFLLFAVSALILLAVLFVLGVASAILVPLAVIGLIVLFFPPVFFIALSFWFKRKNSTAQYSDGNSEGKLYEYIDGETVEVNDGSSNSFSSSIKQAYKHLFSKVRVVKFRR